MVRYRPHLRPPPLRPCRTKQPRRTTPYLALLCLCLVLITAVHLLPINAPPSLSPLPSSVASFHPRSNRVSIWPAPPRCAGTFSTLPARDSASAFPYAVLRDAVLDRRPAAARLLSSGDPPGLVRLVLYVTTHLSARLSMRDAAAVASMPYLLGSVEYVTHVSPFIIPRVPRGYHPGLKTYYGQEVTEWQVGLALRPPHHHPHPHTAVADAAAAGAILDLNITVVRYDELAIPLHLRFPLRCVMGWGQLRGIEDRKPLCTDHLSKATGAALFSGSALYGMKKRDKNHFREIANFAARALMGPFTFDNVVMSVVTDYSASDAQLQCASDSACHDRLDQENANLLHSIAQTVEEELALIGVPSHLFSKLLLVPTCRLGTDAIHSEKDDPCKSSKRYGQYHATFFSYTMLAPFFKWAVSYDLDEFLSPTPAARPTRNRNFGRAADLLDADDARLGGRAGDIVFRWLNFRVTSRNDSRALSAGLVRGNLPHLMQKHKSVSAHCHEVTKDPTGKSAVRCDVGLGFTIHHPVVPVPNKGLQQLQGNRVSREVRAWHARLGSSKGSCDFVLDEVRARVPSS